MIILWYYCDNTVILLWYYCDTTGRADSTGRAGIRRMSGQFCQRRTAGRVDTSQPRVLRLSHLCVCVSLFLVLRLYICANLFSDLYFSICSNRAIFATEWTQASWDSGPSFFLLFFGPRSSRKSSYQSWGFRQFSFSLGRLSQQPLLSQVSLTWIIFHLFLQIGSRLLLRGTPHILTTLLSTRPRAVLRWKSQAGKAWSEKTIQEKRGGIAGLLKVKILLWVQESIEMII